MENTTENKLERIKYPKSFQRRQLYNTPAELASKIDEYFDSCFVEVYDKKLGTDVKKIKTPPTRAGLARYCGFTSVYKLLEFGEKGNTGYDEVVEYALLRLEEFLEGQLVTTKYNPHGLEFALKNTCKWEDKSIRETTGEQVKRVVVKFSDEHVAGEIDDVIDATATPVSDPALIDGGENGKTVEETEEKKEGEPVGAAFRWDGTE